MEVRGARVWRAANCRKSANMMLGVCKDWRALWDISILEIFVMYCTLFAHLYAHRVILKSTDFLLLVLGLLLDGVSVCK